MAFDSFGAIILCGIYVFDGIYFLWSGLGPGFGIISKSMAGNNCDAIVIKIVFHRNNIVFGVFHFWLDAYCACWALSYGSSIEIKRRNAPVNIFRGNEMGFYKLFVLDDSLYVY